MSQYDHSALERQINSVLKYQSEELDSIRMPDMSAAEASISSSEALLTELGYGQELLTLRNSPRAAAPRKIMVVPSWERLCLEAEQAVGTDCELESIFTEEELRSNERAIQLLNEEFDQVHRLDKFDIAISAVAGIVGAAIDILLVGIPKKGPGGIEAGKLSDFIRKKFEEKFPPEEMEKLANSKASKVPYDAQDNRNTADHRGDRPGHVLRGV